MAIFTTRPRLVDFIGWLLLALALIFAVYVRVRLREFPLERDEGEFAYAGQLMLQGVPPYKLAYNMKLPGTYIAYAALMTVFGQTTAGIHLGLLAVNVATILLLYRFVRELFDPFSAGMAAIAYAILSESPSVLGMAAHATHFVAFFGLAGAYLLWRHFQSGRMWQAAAGGLLMGIAFLMKQQGVFLMVFGGVFLVLQGLMLATYPRKRLPITVGLYSLGALLPYGLVCLWLWYAGVWKTFWFWTVEYASKYVQTTSLREAGDYFMNGVLGIIYFNWQLCLLGLAGVVAVAILGKGKPGLRSYVFGFLIFSFFCVCPGFYFRPHYFIVMLPAVAMLIGTGCRLLWDLASGRYWTYFAAASKTAAQLDASQTSKQKRVIPPRVAPELPRSSGGFGPLSAIAVLLLLEAVGATLWVQREFLFVWNPLDACARVYSSNPFVECPKIADYLQAHTDPDDTIAVLGSEPEVFFYAHRHSATGYIYTYGLVEEQPLATRMQKEMIAEIEDKKPKYVVFANVRCSWLTRPNSETEILQWSGDYLKNYQIVGIIEPRSAMQTTYLWDNQVQQYQMPNQPTELDVYWKLTRYPNAPATHNYWRMPYLMVLKRKA